jgi:hypothetical protein
VSAHWRESGWNRYYASTSFSEIPQASCAVDWDFNFQFYSTFQEQIQSVNVNFYWCTKNVWQRFTASAVIWLACICNLFRLKVCCFRHQFESLWYLNGGAPNSSAWAFQRSVSETSHSYFTTGRLPSINSSWRKVPWDSWPVILFSNWTLAVIVLM